MNEGLRRAAHALWDARIGRLALSDQRPPTDDDVFWKACVADVRAVIAAIAEPTDDMTADGAEELYIDPYDFDRRGSAKDVWSAMAAGLLVKTAEEVQADLHAALNVPTVQQADNIDEPAMVQAFPVEGGVQVRLVGGVYASTDTGEGVYFTGTREEVS